MSGAKANKESDAQKIADLRKMNNYRMLKDEDIIGDDDEDEEDLQKQIKAEQTMTAAVPDKWKKLEADLANIREKQAQRDELKSIRKTLEASGEDGTDMTGLSKREQKQMRKAFKELDKLERDNFVAELQKRDLEKTEQKSMGTIVENQD